MPIEMNMELGKNRELGTNLELGNTNMEIACLNMEMHFGNKEFHVKKDSLWYTGQTNFLMYKLQVNIEFQPILTIHQISKPVNNVIF